MVKSTEKSCYTYILYLSYVFALFLLIKWFCVVQAVRFILHIELRFWKHTVRIKIKQLWQRIQNSFHLIISLKLGSSTAFLFLFLFKMYCNNLNKIIHKVIILKEKEKKNIFAYLKLVVYFFFIIQNQIMSGLVKLLRFWGISEVD